MVGFVVVVVSQLRDHVVVIRLGVSLLSTVIKHNMWSYYVWFVAVVRQ
jgi:hypothetical protein